jgi:hypothetical protein
MAPFSEPSKDNSGAIDKAVRQSSPRGLIENVNTIRQWTRPERGHQLREALAGLNPQQVVTYLMFWLDFASAIIEAAGKNPDDYRVLAESETLDYVCAAARLIKQLDKVEASIRLAERFPNRFGLAVHEALLLASFAHQLAIADNETSVWKGEEHNKRLRENAANRSNEGDHSREGYQAKADEIWKRHPDWSKQAVAVLIERDERARVEEERAREGNAPEAKLAKANTIRRLIRKK